MNTCCRKTWEGTFISCDLRSRWVPAMILMFPFLDALKLCLCCYFPPLPLPPGLLLMLSFHPFLFPSFPIEPLASGPPIWIYPRPTSKPSESWSGLLCIRVTLSPSSSSHHYILPLNFKRLFPVTTFLHFSACKCYVIDYYRLHLSHVSSLRCSQCAT